MATKKLKVNRNRYDFGGGVGNIPAELLNYSENMRNGGNNSYMESIINPEAQYQQGLMNYEVDKAARENSGWSKALGTIGNLAVNAGIGIMTQGIGAKIAGIGAKAAGAAKDAAANTAIKSTGGASGIDAIKTGANLSKPKRDYTEVKKGLATFGMNLGGDLLRGLTSLFAEGGVAGEEQNVEHVPIEAEGGEMIAMPWDNQAIPIEGASHENGGVDMTVPVGSKIYSKRVKDAKGVSMAKRKERRDRELKKWEKIVNDDPNNRIAKDTLEKVRRNNEIEEANDMAYMQLHKAKKQFSDYINSVTKDYGKGGGLDIAAARQAIDQYNSQPQVPVEGQRQQYALGTTVTNGNNIFAIANSIKDPNIRAKALLLLNMINNANPNNLPTSKAELDNLMNDKQITGLLADEGNKNGFNNGLYVSKLTGDTIYNDAQRQALAQKYQQQNQESGKLSDASTAFGMFKSQANANPKSPFPTYEELMQGKGSLLTGNTYVGGSTQNNVVQTPNTKQQVVANNTANTNTVSTNIPVGLNSTYKNTNVTIPAPTPMNNIFGVNQWLGIPERNEDTIVNNTQVKPTSNNTQKVVTTNGTVNNTNNPAVPITNSNSFGVLKSDMNNVPPQNTTPLSVNGSGLLSNWNGINLDGGGHGNGRGNLSKEQLGKDIQAINKVISDRISMPYARGFFNPDSQSRRPEDNSISAYAGNPVTQSYMNIVNSDPLYEEHYIPQGSVKAVEQGGGTFVPGLVQLATGEVVPVTPNNPVIVNTGTTPLATVPAVTTNTGDMGNTNVGNGIFVNTPAVVGGVNNTTPVVAGNSATAPAGTSYINGDKIDYKALTSNGDNFRALTRNISDAVFRKANSIPANDDLTRNNDVKALQVDIMTTIDTAKANGSTVPQLRAKLAKVLSKREIFSGQTDGKSEPLTDAINIIMSSLAGTGLKQDNTKQGTSTKGNVNSKDTNTDDNKPKVFSLKLNKDGTVNKESLDDLKKQLKQGTEDIKKQLDGVNLTVDKNSDIIIQEDKGEYKKVEDKKSEQDEDDNTTEKPNLWSVLSGSLNPAFGMQLAGIIHNMVKPQQAARDNFNAKQRYKNNYRDYGKKSLLELDKMKDNLQAVMQQNLRELEDQRAAQTYINNNSARDINVARALNLAALSKTMDATNRVYANQAALQNNIHQARANMLSNIDHRVMGEDRNTQTLNNQIIDSYFNNKATADMIFGTGLQNIGKLFDNREFIKQLKNMYKERMKSSNSKSNKKGGKKDTIIYKKLVQETGGKGQSKQSAKTTKPTTKGAVPN